MTPAGPVAGEPVLGEVISRARGCLLGQIAGDSLGSLVEFKSASEIRDLYPQGVRELRDGGVFDLLAGQPTDDSEMALMLARALAERRAFDEWASLRGYLYWFRSGPFDIGNTIAAALAAAARAQEAGRDPAAAAREEARRMADQGSQANGALMRISPLGIFGYVSDPADVAAWARADASLTHAHPLCLDANAVYAVAISHAIRSGDDAREVYAFAVDWADDTDVDGDVRHELEAAQSAPPADYAGWVRHAFRNAFYRLLHAKTLEDALAETIAGGKDTDTNAAVAGALLGAVHGEEAIPASWRAKILACRPDASRREVRHPRPRVFWPVDAGDLAEKLIEIGGARKS